MGILPLFEHSHELLSHWTGVLIRECIKLEEENDTEAKRGSVA
jgi:hypothetical protein